MINTYWEQREKPWKKAVLDYCRHPQHNPPSHLYIPPGSEYIHRCPGCGSEVKLFGSMVSLTNESTSIF